MILMQFFVCSQPFPFYLFRIMNAVRDFVGFEYGIVGADFDRTDSSEC